MHETIPFLTRWINKCVAIEATSLPSKHYFLAGDGLGEFVACNEVVHDGYRFGLRALLIVAVVA